VNTVYLIGDAGDISSDDPLIPLVNRRLNEHSETNNALIFLGDNIYHNGLPAGNDPDRSEKEKIIINQMDIASGYQGNVFFIPGNHDWDDAGEEGLTAVRREEEFVEDYLGKGNSFHPDNGCPGPVAVNLGEDLLLILIDSQWWLHKHEIPQGEDCSPGSKEAFTSNLVDLVQSNSERNILLAGHHPVLSNGEHGGRFGIKDHIFPLTNVRNYLYIPLPVIGSIYPIARSAGVSRQDTPNKVFKTYSAVIDSVSKIHDRLLYASGHDHNLQYIEKNNVRQIVSGSGSKVKYVSKGRGADFVYQERGYACIRYYANQQVWIDYVAVTDEITGGSVIFRKRLF
ncbi:MAG: metallophosphoesterase, partial [Cyclobacteriaceae bacterium]